jgi:hypothetical protein
MKKFTQIEAEIFIIDYLLTHRYIGHKQTTFENMVLHVPANDRKIVTEALKNIIRKGFKATKKKHYGIHISLIPSKLDDIREYLYSIEKS